MIDYPNNSMINRTFYEISRRLANIGKLKIVGKRTG